MSVPLVHFRLEVAEHCDKLVDFHYKAIRGSPRLTYAEVLSPAPSKTYTKEEIENHQGRRHHRLITLETHIPDVGVSNEVLEDMSAQVDLSDCPVTLDMGPYGTGESSEQCQHPTSSKTVTDHSTQEEDSDKVPPLLEHSSKHGRRQKQKDKGAAENKATQQALEKTVSFSATSDGDANSFSGGACNVDNVSKGVTLSSKRKSKSPSPAPLSLPSNINSLDEEEGKSSRPGSAKGRGRAHSLAFFSGNPCVETTEGIIHLYKEDQLVGEDSVSSMMICMLNVPASMTSQDMLQFVAPVEPWIEHFKIIRDATPNQYMVLLKFRSQKFADDFYKNFNNKAFNSLEPDVCQLVYVDSIETLKPSEGAGLPVAGMTELPTCPVCLERMDESVNGILTILCNHSFHGSCLAQWGDTSCPVCRYIQTPEAVGNNKCFGCECKENLWICLICGHVGCGRYDGGHAYRHFQETQHTYAMQLDNNRVWDYAGDNYVHRLVQSKGDGKLVEVDEGGRAMEDEKLDSITLEYTYLLTSQLESQRHYFEEKMEQVEKEALKQVEDGELRSKATVERCGQLQQQLEICCKDRQGSERKVTQLSTKMTKVLRSLQEEQELNKSLQQNQQQWQTKVCELQQHMTTKDSEVEELQAQLRDVMFYLEAQQQLSATSEVTQSEIQEGQIVVTSPPQGGASAKRIKKKAK